MATLHDYLKFIRVKSYTAHIIQWTAVRILIILMLIPLSYAVYYGIMEKDRKQLISYIDNIFNVGYTKIYDFIEAPKWNKSIQVIDEKSVGKYEAFYPNPGIAYYAKQQGMVRYTRPGCSPYEFNTFEKIAEGEYCIKNISAIGVGYYDYDFSVFFYELEDPDMFYNTFRDEVINSELRDYSRRRDNFQTIQKILSTKEGYPVNEYDAHHYTSRFHSLELNSNALYNDYFSQYTFERTDLKTISNYRGALFYKIVEDHFSVQKKPGNNYATAFSIIIGTTLLLILGIILIIFLPKERRKIKFYGKVWISENDEKAIVFEKSILGKNFIQIIECGKTCRFSFNFSNDKSLIKLSNGEINKLLFTESSETGQRLQYGPEDNVKNFTLYPRSY